MTDKDNLTIDPITGEPRTSTSDGAAAVESSTLTLTELNQFLGKDFKDKDSALKALKDTQSFVGKRKEDIEAEVRANTAAHATSSSNPELESQVKSLAEQLFYTQNPQFKDYQDVIKAMGSNPAEVVESGAFKKVFEQGKAALEAAQTRSVVNSNPRLAQARTTADEAIKVANSRGTTVEDVAAVLARGILEQEEAQ